MSLLAEYFDVDGLAQALADPKTGKKPTKRTLKSWRDQRRGPPVTYIGGRPFYRKESARKWLVALEGKQRGAA